MLEQKKIINSWLLGLYLFQFGILLPIALIINIEVPYTVSTSAILLISLIINKLYFNKLFILSSIFILSIMLLSFLVHSIEDEIVIMILFGFIAKGLSGFYLASNKINFEKLYTILVRLAWVNLIILLFGIIIFDLNNFVGYMRLGYALVPSSVILLGKVITSKFSVMDIIGFLLSIVLLLLYGNRGVFLVIIIFIIFILLFVWEKNLKTLIWVTLSVLFLSLIISMNLISRFILYLYEDLNIYSYTLMKFTRSFEEGFISASSGREILYVKGFNWFLENPFFGNGIGYTFTYTTTTAHNILLQILIESGIIGFLLIMLIAIYAYYYINKIKDRTILMVLAVLFSLSFGRLLVSSDLWLRPELWLFLGILVGLINHKTYNELPELEHKRKV